MATPRKPRKKKPTATRAQYSDRSFWATVKRSAKAIGESTLTTAFTLYNTFNDDKTPIWAKTVVGGAIAYLILPLDAIPDYLPVIGFVDDAGALAAASATVAAHITPTHKREGKRQMEEFFS